MHSEIVKASYAAGDRGIFDAQRVSMEQQPTATAVLDSHSPLVAPSSDSEQREFRSFIDQLPDEILSQIFRLVHSNGWMTHTALKMATVCRRWRLVATGTGMFWTDVRAGQVDLAYLSAERSQEASLDLFLSESRSSRSISRSLNPQTYPIFPEKAVNLLIANICRISTLAVKMHCENYPELLQRLEPLTAPNLRAIRLDFPQKRFIQDQVSQAAFHDTDSPTSRHLLKAPRLEQLSIRTYKLHREITVYPNVISLTLQLGIRTFLDLHNSSFILGTLRAHQNLTDFRLILMAPLCMQRADTNVQLLHLKCLSLQVRQPEDAWYLLHWMEIPNIAQVELDLGTRHPSDPATMGFRLQNIILSLPAALLWIPLTTVFDRTDFSMLIDMRHHPWSNSTVSICLRWSGLIDAIVHGVVQSLIESFPRLRLAICDEKRWAVKRRVRV